MTRDPWFFQRWAFDQKTGNPVRKSVLSMLATMADAETGRCEAKQDTLAEGSEVSERAVRGHLRTLVEMGLIARRPQFRIDGGRRGDEYLLLAPEVTHWPDGAPIQPAAPSGGSPGTDPPHPPAPRSGQEQPPVNGHASKQEKERAREAAANAIPDGFPDELRPHARTVMKVLKAVAAQHGAKRVTAAAVGNAIMPRQRRPLVRVAFDLAAWAADPPRPIRDVVGTYRTFLDRERDLEVFERLGADGLPASGPVALPPGVTRLADRRETRKAAWDDYLARHGHGKGPGDVEGSCEDVG